eukprot:1140415-Prymnesium_polylepis.1
MSSSGFSPAMHVYHLEAAPQGSRVISALLASRVGWVALLSAVPCLAPSSPVWLSQARLLLRLVTTLPDLILTVL